MMPRTLIVTGLLTLAALALIPSPASAATCPDLQGGGGVVGDTVSYAGDMTYIGCTAALAEAGVVADAAVASCDATVDYLLGGGCASCTCPPQPILPIQKVLDSITMTMSSGSSPPSAGGATPNTAAIAPLHCSFGLQGNGGVVGDTVDYAVAMGNIGCDALMGTAGVALTATFSGCYATFDYLVGQPSACYVSWL